MCVRVRIHPVHVCGHDVLNVTQAQHIPTPLGTQQGVTLCPPPVLSTVPTYYTHLLILHLLLLWVGVIKPHDQLALERQLVVLVQERCMPWHVQCAMCHQLRGETAPQHCLHGHLAAPQTCPPPPSCCGEPTGVGQGEKRNFSAGLLRSELGHECRRHDSSVKGLLLYPLTQPLVTDMPQW